MSGASRAHLVGDFTDSDQLLPAGPLPAQVPTACFSSTGTFITGVLTPGSAHREKAGSKRLCSFPFRRTIPAQEPGKWRTHFAPLLQQLPASLTNSAIHGTDCARFSNQVYLNAHQPAHVGVLPSLHSLLTSRCQQLPVAPHLSEGSLISLPLLIPHARTRPAN